MEPGNEPPEHVRQRAAWTLPILMPGFKHALRRHSLPQLLVLESDVCELLLDMWTVHRGPPLSVESIPSRSTESPTTTSVCAHWLRLTSSRFVILGRMGYSDSSLWAPKILANPVSHRPSRNCRARLKFELLQNVGDVVAGRVVADGQGHGDLLVGLALDEQLNDLALALR